MMHYSKLSEEEQEMVRFCGYKIVCPMCKRLAKKELAFLRMVLETALETQ